jgi:hypothetical protein
LMYIYRHWRSEKQNGRIANEIERICVTVCRCSQKYSFYYRVKNQDVQYLVTCCHNEARMKCELISSRIRTMAFK